MSSTTEIALLVVGVAGILWVCWVYYLEAKHYYQQDTLAQKRSLEQQRKQKKENK